ncbi:hypothetical protein H2200_011847 [Cladophialophora chaetospira]|uniref:Fucose-specific lectin n=1 Tax=Cladophialophora chaetospira TaxID=386627 RepID=A0AA38WYU7_9EURO|nr:hypothetical protein H2200_011847 [Cladophialophora chaetospira]
MPERILTNNKNQNLRPPAPRDSSIPHTEDRWLQPAVTDDDGNNAPEVVVDPGKEVKPEQEKEHYISPDRAKHDSTAAADATGSPGPRAVQHDGAAATETTDTRGPRFLGFRRRTLLICLIVLILVIIGAVVGGVLGSRASHHSESAQASGLGASTSTISTPSATSANSVQSVSTSSSTSSPTNTGGPVVKAAFKYPSIAITGSGLPRITKLFTLHSSNNSVTLHIKNSSGWQAWGEVSLHVPPFKGSPLAAASWVDGNFDQIRLYYIDENTELVELAARCQNGNECDWNGEKSLVREGASNTTGLSISQWGNTTTAPFIQLRLYYVDDNNYLQQMNYNGGWKDPVVPGQSVGENSGLASIADDDTNTVERLFYSDPNGNFIGLRRNPGHAFALTDVWFTNTAYKPTLYNLATCLYPSTDLSESYLTVKQIVEDGSVAEAWKVASQGDWATEASADAIAANWARADDVGGAIACTGWKGANGKANQLLIYSIGGTMTEYWLHDGTWTQTAIFDT